ncbi:hypothetical protein CWM47_31980 [Spirosoma pollinicola]|uniref:Uncharacterized protein n=1 Tax=Spirosoma pollinicola TaxID=2057025 RepID=A0A2K8Z880_9BACT|nr:hypothetical protein CWM47_31980 [Spirosoma pollinicola]
MLKLQSKLGKDKAKLPVAMSLWAQFGRISYPALGKRELIPIVSKVRFISYGQHVRGRALSRTRLGAQFDF